MRIEDAVAKVGGPAPTSYVQVSGGGGGGGGDASAANQTAGNATLTAIDGHVDGLEGAIGAAADAAASADTGTFSLIAIVKRLVAKFPAALGSTTASASFPVTLSSDGPFSTLSGAVTETAPASDTASSGLNGRLQRIAQRITSLIGLLPASLGQKAKTAALAVTLASDEDLLANTGGVTETAPASDTASSGLNGRLQRIAQRLTMIIAGIPLLAGEAHIGEVGGKMIRVNVVFTRPADTNAYTAGDVVSDSTSATTMLSFALPRVTTGSMYIVSAILATNKKSITPRFRVHMFSDNTATVVADNVQYKELYADVGKGQRYFDLPAMTTAVDTTNSDMSKAQDNTLRFPMMAASGASVVYVVLEALDAFTPSSGQSFTLIIHADVN